MFVKSFIGPSTRAVLPSIADFCKYFVTITRWLENTEVRFGGWPAAVP